METIKLIETRKAKGYTQNQIADILCMDVSNYNRRESGLAKISISEWEKLAKTLNVPFNEIFEPDENQVFFCKDNASINNHGTNNIYAVPESLLETQQKYIKKLEEENIELKKLLEKK